MKKKPETIENRWDILYKDYPGVYDEFAKTEKDGNDIKAINKISDLKGKVVVDIGSGTGLSTFQLAEYAKFVYGIEPENAMRKLAVRKAKEKNIKNVKFLKGRAEKIPLRANSVDGAVAITSIGSNHSDLSSIQKVVELVIKEVSRVVKKGGYFIILNIAPYWYGGELAPIILGKGRKTEEDIEGKIDKVLRTKFDFKYKDVYVLAKFGSLKKALETYGFIFGKKAIEYLKKHNKTTVKWKFRIHYRKI